jgi:hypothetical protein
VSRRRQLGFSRCSWGLGPYVLGKYSPQLINRQSILGSGLRSTDWPCPRMPGSLPDKEARPPCHALLPCSCSYSHGARPWWRNDAAWRGAPPPEALRSYVGKGYRGGRAPGARMTPRQRKASPRLRLSVGGV